jgi:hypothetical protein
VTARPIRNLAAIATVLSLGLSQGCHHDPAKDPDTFLGRAQAIPHRNVKPAIDARAYPGLKSSVILTVPDKSVGPFLARKSGVAMGAYLGPDESGTSRRIVSLPMGPDGVPRDARVVATVVGDSTTFVLRPAGGEEPRFIAAWTLLTDRGESLSVTGIGVDGLPTLPPIELERSTDDIVWVEITPTPKGETIVWAEETRSSDANILAVALDTAGKPRGVPSRVARGVTAWQAVTTPSGTGIAVASSVTDKAGKASSGSVVTWIKLDGEARPVGLPLPIATSPSKVTDLDAVAIQDSIVFAWTDRSEPDPNLWLAAVDGEGKLKPPHSVTTRLGGAKLAVIAGGRAGGAVVWEEARKRPRPERRLHVAKVDRDANLGTESAIVGADPTGVPELAVLGDGFGLLTRARTCVEPLGPNDVPCSEAPLAPIFVRFDLGLHAAETEPIRIDESATVASLAWGLSCEAEQCLVLGIGQENPAKVRAIELTELPNRWRAPVPASGGAAGPKVLGVDTVEGGDLFADVAAAPLDDGSLVAAVTADGGDAKGGGGASRGATVLLRALDPTGMPRGAARILSKRALSAGGVSIATAPKGEGAAVAWVAREGASAAIHITRVDIKGQRTNDIQLTTAHGDASDVALAWAGSGWIVAWVDTRDGNGEVYATKVDLGLNRVAREERITNAPGDASDVTLLARPLAAGGGDVWLAWADPRDNPHEGFADVFVTKLSAVSAKPIVPEARVLATAAHSRSPALAWTDDTHATIAWIEEAPLSAGSDNSGSYGAMIGSLDDNGHLVGDVLRTHGAGDGFPTAIAIERGAGSLHVVFARAARDDLSLDAIDLVPGHEPTPALLFVLDGPPTLDLSLSLEGGAVFFNDEGVDVGDGRARRLGVGWPH